jgi:hypothetical protein
LIGLNLKSPGDPLAIVHLKTQQNGASALSNGHHGRGQNGLHQRRNSSNNNNNNNKTVANGKQQKGVNGHNGMCIQQAFYDDN